MNGLFEFMTVFFLAFIWLELLRIREELRKLNDK